MKGPGLSTLDVEYINDLPEYHSSHIHGYTYVVAARGRSQEEMEKVAHNVGTFQLLSYYLLSISLDSVCKKADSGPEITSV